MTRADPGDAEDITAELALNVMCCAPRQKAAALEMPLLVRLTLSGLLAGCQDPEHQNP